jgi:2-oxoglutarate/2-oxoacid ferredoxin oxidoreductase subunit beta
MVTNGPLPVLTAKDFENDLDVRWCPGCGDYSILAQMKKVLPEVGIPKEKIVFVSGIGCSSRFPYYLSTFGFHTIHGRAPTVASGLKLANPDLSVWVITGDGDGLSIGGNHLMHAIRRNINLNIILFNNRIYGLTKGQYSPTSPVGHKTKSTPFGSLDRPITALTLAIAAEATFVARTADRNPAHLQYVLKRAAQHQGVSFVEVYQDCVVFNKGAFDYSIEKGVKDETTINIEHGKPLIFGAKKDKGIRLNGHTPEVVSLADVSPDELLIHDERAPDSVLAHILSQMAQPYLPEPMGVFRAIEEPCYEQEVLQQVADTTKKFGPGDLNKLYRSADTWTVT